jgi:transcriptional regulator with XRE-family HTH domain
LSKTGDRLRKLREGLGISQAKLGELAGMTQSTINRYETGYSAAPLKTLIWYADYFDVFYGLPLLPDRQAAGQAV